MMKVHSFVRENVPRVLTWAEEKTSMKLSNFVPFLFADSYDIFISDVFLMLIISSHSCHL